MVGANDPCPLYTPFLQSLETGKKVGKVLLVFKLDAPSPRPRSLFDQAPGVLRQGSTRVIPDVKPLRVPSLVRGRQTHERVIPRPGMAQMNAGTSHRHIHLLPPDPPLRQTDGEEVSPQIKVGIDPEETLAQGNKRCHMLNPIGS